MNRRESLKLMLAASGAALAGAGHADASDTTATSEDSGVSRREERRGVKPAFAWLTMGEVKPGGWIKEQMLRDLQHGFAGCLGKLCHEASSDIFVTHRNTLHQQNAANFAGVNWWNGETEGNWRAGFLMMSYLSGDQEKMREADAYVEHILSSQDADGYLGAFGPDCRFLYPGDLWTQACLLRGLLAYSELSGSRQTFNAVRRCADLIISTYGGAHTTVVPWGQNHDLMIVDVMEWLSDRTGDPKYTDFSVWFYDKWSQVEASADGSLPSLLDRNKGFKDHGVHTYESLRVPLWLWFATGRRDIGEAARNGLDKMGWYRETGGSEVSEEWIKNLKPDPTYTEYEYCSSKESQLTLESALQKYGAPGIGDKIEHLWFNAAQGSRTADGRAITYLTPDNRLRCVGTLPSGSGRQPRNKFSPTHKDVAVCCNPNAANVAALFVRGMWMRPRDGGLAALLYGPCAVSTNVGGVKLQIEERTNYPFEHTVEIELRPEREITFPLMLREPAWSDGTKISCPGAQVSREGGYFLLKKRWKAGDLVRIEFQPRVRVLKAVNGEVALAYGPLVFAQPLESSTIVKLTYPVAGFEDTYLAPIVGRQNRFSLPASARWNAFGFQPATGAAKAGRDRPFDAPVITLEGNAISAGGKEEALRLIPLGNAWGLRWVTFPVRS